MENVDQLITPNFIQSVVFNNPDAAMNAASNNGFNAQSASDTAGELVQAWNSKNIAAKDRVKSVLQSTPFIEKKDPLSHYIHQKNTQKGLFEGVSAETWVGVGASAVGILGAIVGGGGENGETQNQNQNQNQGGGQTNMMPLYIGGGALLLVIIVLIATKK